MYIYADKISLNLAEHGFFFSFSFLLQCELFSLKVSLRKERVPIYFNSPKVFFKKILLNYLFFEREKEGESDQLVAECIAPNWGPGPQLRSVP